MQATVHNKGSDSITISDTNRGFKGDDSNKGQVIHVTKGGNLHARETTSARELQLIKSVTGIVAIFVACNTLIFVHYLTTVLIPDYNTSAGSPIHTYNVIALCSVLAVVNISSSMNVVVYLKTNRKFREAFVLRCSHWKKN